MMSTKTLKFLFIILLTITISKSYAIGSFALGGSIGISPDYSGLSTYINELNNQMSQYNILYSTGSTSYIDNLLGITISTDIRYQWNSLLIKIGAIFTKNYWGGKGSVTSTDLQTNNVKINANEFLVPISIGYSLFIVGRKKIYLLTGPLAFTANIDFTQGNTKYQIELFPDTGTETIANQIYNISGIGWHFCIGIEFDLTEKISIMTEWLHYSGKSSRFHLPSDAYYNIHFKGDKFTTGILYYVNI